MIKRVTYALVLLLAVATPASARNIMSWECAPDKVTVELTFTAPWKTVRHYYNHEITIVGLRDPVKDRVTFKLVRGLFAAYLNGKRCKETPPDDSSPAPTAQP
jgi:hypothetical protein